MTGVTPFVELGTRYVTPSSIDFDHLFQRTYGTMHLVDGSHRLRLITSLFEDALDASGLARRELLDLLWTSLEPSADDPRPQGNPRQWVRALDRAARSRRPWSTRNDDLEFGHLPQWAESEREQASPLKGDEIGSRSGSPTLQDVPAPVASCDMLMRLLNKVIIFGRRSDAARQSRNALRATQRRSQEAMAPDEPPGELVQSSRRPPRGPNAPRTTPTSIVRRELLACA